VNVVPEQDLELLEEYLDGALPPGEAERLRGRIGREPELAAALEELEADRASRAAVWSALEPDEAEVQRFAKRVTTAARRTEVWGHVRRYARFGSAAAACLLLGYFVGWAEQGRGPGGPGRPGGTSVNQVSGGNAGSSGARSSGRYHVPVGYDESGRPITQDFDTFEEAKRFADEVRWLQELRQDYPLILREQL